MNLTERSTKWAEAGMRVCILAWRIRGCDVARWSKLPPMPEAARA